MSFNRGLISRAVVVGSAVCIGKLIRSHVVCQKSIPFDTKGLPAHHKGPFGTGDNLTLVGVGMRRKNLYIVEVDVYRVGLSLSEAVVKEVKHSLSDGKFSAPLAETILSSQTPPKSKAEDASTAAVTLDFVRTVSIKQMVQAFDDALLGCEKAAIAAFSQGLYKVIHEGAGFKEGDKLRIYWQKSGGVILTCGDKVSDVIYNKELSRRLLEVYVDDARSVSKDLIKCIKDNVHEVEAN